MFCFSRMLSPLAIALVAVLFGAFGQHAAAGFDWQWHTGRATHYGSPGDAWSIHNGHCGYGYLDPNVGTGWDIAAPSDVNWDYDQSTSSCGVCYEIACQGMSFNDFYGQWLERNSVCYDSSQSVVVMITDVCPCYYPPNAYSNKRWCCGDMQHFDVSAYAFEKLADLKWGVIGIKYRRVPCDYAPQNRAPAPGNPIPSYESPPWNWDSSKDKRWGVMGSAASASSSDSSSSAASSYSSSSDGRRSSVSISSGDGSGGSQSSVTNAYYGGFMTGWSDSGSWSISKWGRDSSWSFDGQQAYCVTLGGYGGIQFNAWSGVFSSKSTLEFYARQNNGGAPDISIKIQGSSGACKAVRLRDYTPKDANSNWSRFQIQLSDFDWRTNGGGGGSAFSGCSDSINDWSVNTLLFTNQWGGNQDLCIDQVKVF